MKLPVEGNGVHGPDMGRISQTNFENKNLVRILVVDDDDASGMTIGLMLKTANYEVISASNAFEALKIFDESPVDMVLTDLAMPRMSGWELIEELRKRSSDIPILLLTASAELTVLECSDRVEKLGINKVLLKPIRMKDLLAEVEPFAKKNTPTQPA
ncbi:response regulator [bacterium]|nr:response regulator [bacterium]